MEWEGGGLGGWLELWNEFVELVQVAKYGCEKGWSIGRMIR